MRGGGSPSLGCFAWRQRLRKTQRAALQLGRPGSRVELGVGDDCTPEPDADAGEAHAPRPLQAATVMYRIAFGSRVGHKVPNLRGAMPREAAPRQPLSADIDGFSLHVAVRCESHDRKRLEQLRRHITRPALSDEGLQCNAAVRWR